MSDNPQLTAAPIADSLGNTINPAQEDGNLSTLLTINIQSMRLQELQLLQSQAQVLMAQAINDKTAKYTFQEIR